MDYDLKKVISLDYDFKKVLAMDYNLQKVELLFLLRGEAPVPIPGTKSNPIICTFYTAGIS